MRFLHPFLARIFLLWLWIPGASPRALAYSASDATSYAVRAIAGSDWVGDGGPSRDALLLQAEGLAADRDGNLYISDAQAHRVRQINTAGVIRTVAGTGSSGYSGDGGQAVAAQLSTPYGIAVDGFGQLYVADLGNHCVRRVGRDGVITTVATGFLAPRNVAVSSSGVLYVADFEGNRVYRVDADGTKTVIAGTGAAGYTGDGTAAAAPLDHPAGLAVDVQGIVYIGDTQNHMVRKVEGGVISQVAATSSPTGLAIDAKGALRITQPGELDVAYGRDGSLYVTDGRLIRHIFTTANGTTTVTIAGLGDSAHGDLGPATQARLNNPTGVAVDGAGSLYIADRDNNRIRKVDTKGVITTFSGAGTAGNSGDGSAAVAATLNAPSSVSLDAAGNLYVMDSGNHRIRVVDTAGIIRGADSMPDPVAAAMDTAGNRYFIDGAYRITRVDPGGAVTFLETNMPILVPTFVTAGANDLLYVADADRDIVWELTPVPVASPPVVDPPAALPVTRHIEVVNSASLTPGPLAPGSLATIRGGAVPDPQVVFGETAATVLETRGQDVIVLVPATLASGSVAVQLRSGGQSVAQATVAIAPVAPALFGIVHLDGTLNSADNPAPRGSVVMLFGTGQGTGDLGGTAVYFGGFVAEVLYSGSVPGYPGLWQMNVRVPGGFLPPGDRPVTASVGGAVAASIDAYIE